MATYKVIDTEQLEADLTDVADRIRAKGETSEELAWPDGFKSAISAIETGTNEVIPYRESDEGNSLRMCAHRGYHAYVSENTADAVLAALNMGYGYVEFDISVSSDGVYYVEHDSYVYDIYGTKYTLLSTSSDVLDEILCSPPTAQAGFTKIDLPRKMTRLSAVFEAAELIDRDYELWVEFKNITTPTQIDTFIAYLNENVSATLRSKIRLLGGGNTYLHSSKVWDKTLYYAGSGAILTSDDYDVCVAAQDLGIDVIPYVSFIYLNHDVAEQYYNEHGLKTALFTFAYIGNFGALAKLPYISILCGDNLPSWNWPDLFNFKEESEFENTETWDFATDGTGSQGTTFTTSGTVTYEDGATLGTAATYMWFNLPPASKCEGVAQFEIEWTPTTTNQRIFRIGAYNDPNGFAANNVRLGFYAGAWHYLNEYNTTSTVGETETHTVKVYWNAYAYMVYVDGKVVGSWTINFNTATTNAGRNFCFGSNSTAFLGTIRNLQMWY